MAKFKYVETARYFGAAMKDQEKQTIVPRWPFRLVLRPGQPGAQQEFDQLLAGGVSGKEHYLEWRRVCL